MRSWSWTAKGSFLPLMTGPHCLCNISHADAPSICLTSTQSDWLVNWAGPCKWAVDHELFIITPLDCVMPLAGQIASPHTLWTPTDINALFSRDHHHKGLCCFMLHPRIFFPSVKQQSFMDVDKNCTPRIYHSVPKYIQIWTKLKYRLKYRYRLQMSKINSNNIFGKTLYWLRWADWYQISDIKYVYQHLLKLTY